MFCSRTNDRFNCGGSSNRNAFLRAQLAGEADGRVSARADAFKHEGFASGRRRQRRIVEHADAAGRASRLAAADAGVRDIAAKARFQHAVAARRANRSAAGIGQGDHALPALAQVPHAACGKDKTEHCCIADGEIDVDEIIEQGALRRGRLDKVRGPVLRILHQLHHRARAMFDPNDRQHWQQHCKGQQEGRRPHEGALQAQPVIEADAAVYPRDDNEHELQPVLPRTRHPVGVERVGVVVDVAEQRCRHPDPNEMNHQQDRDAEAEQKLGDLARGVANLSPFIERPQAETPVGQRRSIEHCGHDRVAPERYVILQPLRHRGIGDVAQRMTGVVRDQIGKQHDAAGDPHLAQADAAEDAGRPYHDGHEEPATRRPELAMSLIGSSLAASDVNNGLG